MENLNIALLLMVVGMATVFAILLIVIYLGKAMTLRYRPTSWQLSMLRLRW